MSQLYAGAARADITPELGHNLAGWVQARPATRRVTPILARALALATDDVVDDADEYIRGYIHEQAILISCDLLWVPGPLSKRVREAVQECCGVPAQHVFIFPSHNHYGPNVDPAIWSYAEAQTPQELAYIEALPEQFATAARAALDDLRPAHWGIGTDEEDAICHNSRFWRKDGTINWVGERSAHWASDRAPSVNGGPIDPQVGLVLISDERGAPIATLYNYACHANCAEEAGFSAISWDWVGYASQAIEEALGGEALFLLGACGNVHPVREGVAQEMGRRMGDRVVRAAQGIKTTRRASMTVSQREIVLPARDFGAFDPRQIEAICSQLWNEEVCSITRGVFLDELQTLRAAGRSQTVAQIGAIRLGDLAIVCIPGEFFVELGLEIKRRSPFAHTFVATLVNDAIGYIPTRKAYEEGGYQTTTVARIAPGGGERIVEESLALLEALNPAAWEPPPHEPPSGHNGW
ncbi:MAG TPA: hypothetical protein VMY80_14325 [Anaerolineae bacterium]|nr:hypothetical protein [Anaerolineae bacterium]